ncbi:MAG: hypothetical protein UDY71_08705, partial [Slackia isoflavoniconvertens]|nr:hypothetical protein [Slackia isoflavoniconvertens]
HVGGSRPDALTVYGHKKTSHSSDFYFLVQEMGGSSYPSEYAFRMRATADFPASVVSWLNDLMWAKLSRTRPTACLPAQSWSVGDDQSFPAATIISSGLMRGMRESVSHSRQSPDW